MQTLKGIKLELEGELRSFCVLDGQSKICNWLYNHLLEIGNELRDEFKASGNSDIAKILYTKRGMRNLVPELKKKHSFLKTVHSSPLKNVALRLTQSIQNYQKCLKGKRKGASGWPKFRSWNAEWCSLFYDEPKKGFRVEGRTLYLSLGQEKTSKRLSLQFQLKEAHLLKGLEIRNVTITCENGKYYAVFCVKVPLPARKPGKKMIALDPNHKNFAYGVDTAGIGIEILSPKWLKTYDKRIDELKSRKDRCNRFEKKSIVIADDGSIKKEYFTPSRNWSKREKALKKALHKRREQTKTFMFTLAHALCKKYDCIAIGDYAPRGNGITRVMRRSMNNRSLIGRFKKVLLWTAQKSGKTYIEYNEKGTTRTCHVCGYMHDFSLHPSIRQWVCPDCQAEHIRDENAAINGLRKASVCLPKEYGAIASIVPCSGLISVRKRWAWCVLPGGVRNKAPSTVRTANPRNTRKLNQGREALGQKLVR